MEHSWERIENHTCGRFKEEHVAKMEHAKSALTRYTHYHNRYKAHTDSLKAEMALKENLKEKISGMEVKGSIKDYTWVTDGADRLLRSRQVLSCSYPFSYYTFGDTFLGDEMTKEDRIIKQNLFEDLQQEFEGHIEKLSFLLVEPFGEYSEVKLVELRKKIIEFSRLTDVLCKNL